MISTICSWFYECLKEMLCEGDFGTVSGIGVAGSSREEALGDMR